MRLGFFGGAFDPLHIAHLRLAEEARVAAELDMVYFLPTAAPPHKQEAAASFSDRLAMVQLGLAGNPFFRVDTLELDRKGPSYTYDTLCALQQRYPQAERYFIIGMDSYCDIGTWFRFQELFALASFIVVQRPGHGALEDALDLLPACCRDTFVYSDGGGLEHLSGNKILFIQGAPMAIASRDIRQLIAKEGSIRYLVPEAVEDYIAQKGLYRL